MNAPGGAAAMMAADESLRRQDAQIRRIVQQETVSLADYRLLLAEMSPELLEALARRSRELTVRHFGKTIGLYAPLYVANFCDNDCRYCGFKASNTIARRRLSLEEVCAEAQALAAQGISHLLIVCGGSRPQTPLPYLLDCVAALRPYAASVWLEIYPLASAEYAALIDAGADGLVLYQETYDRDRYRAVHRYGEKSDFDARLRAVEAACAAGMRAVTIGALLGLADFGRDAYCLGEHALYLQRRYPAVEIGCAVPRLRPEIGGFTADYPVGDRHIVQLICALRLLLPSCGITVSTRETAAFRDHSIKLGVTRLSAGSRTTVGGYTQTGSTSGQFEIADNRRISEIHAMIARQGYQPVYKNWQMC